MDVRTTPPAPRPENPGEPSPPDRPRGVALGVLSSLSHELCRPLISLKAGFDLLLGEPSATFTPDQRSHLLTMVTLCDDLLRLTRSYLDYAGIVQGSRPLCLGSFTIGALIHEIARQFAPVAAARQRPLGDPRRFARDRRWSPTPHAASRSSATWSPTR